MLHTCNKSVYGKPGSVEHRVHFSFAGVPFFVKGINAAEWWNASLEYMQSLASQLFSKKFFNLWEATGNLILFLNSCTSCCRLMSGSTVFEIPAFSLGSVKSRFSLFYLWDPMYIKMATPISWTYSSKGLWYSFVWTCIIIGWTPSFLLRATPFKAWWVWHDKHTRN